MAIDHLPEDIRTLVENEGWTESRVISHLLGFIREQVENADAELAAYLQANIDEENIMALDVEPTISG